MTKALAGLIAAGLLVGPRIAAAQDPVATRVEGAMESTLKQPDCKLEGGDFRVSSGKTYLKTGIEGTGDPSNRVNALKNGVRVLTEAITTAGQGKTPAAWYWLGRIYLQQGNLVGADSAFSKAEALAPGCKVDISRNYRYRAWAALVNAGTGFRQAKQDDSALVMYRAANQIYPEPPLASWSMASIFAARSQNDSAMYYFGQAANAEPTDTLQVSLRNQAAFNYGVVLLNANRPAEAVVALRRYLKFKPEDAVAQKALGQAFRAAGMPDSAQAVEHQLVVAASTGAGAGGGDEELSDRDLFDLATRQYDDKHYADAATTYGRLLQRNPYNRDALYALANSYLGLQDGQGLAATAQKLIALDPLGDYNYQMLAQGYKFTKQQDKVAEAIIAEFALPVDLEFDRFDATADGATFAAKAVGREARDQNNKVIPPHPVTIAVEFLGKDGSVLGTETAAIPSLKVGESAPVKVATKTPGVQAWRYKTK